MRTPIITALLLSTLPVFATTHPRHKLRATTATVRHTSTSKKSSIHTVFHEGMAPERATEIQSALIKQGYLTGEPSGSWDGESIAAMQKLQSDNGWQTKFTPDARALNKLGLANTSTASTTASSDAQ